jgi:hypothetical protein
LNVITIWIALALLCLAQIVAAACWGSPFGESPRRVVSQFHLVKTGHYLCRHFSQ